MKVLLGCRFTKNGNNKKGKTWFDEGTYSQNHTVARNKSIFKASIKIYKGLNFHKTKLFHAKLSLLVLFCKVKGYFIACSRQIAI
jgi:hypothetical protein